MPELPEVEVICRGLNPHVTKRRVCRIIYSGKKLRNNVPFSLLKRKVVGSTIVDIGRRAKYLLFHIDSGDILIIHLGMTGKLGIFPQRAEKKVHDHLLFLFDDGMELRYNDVRRFGSVNLLQENEVATMEDTFFKNTGPEPFSKICSANYLHTRAKGSGQAIKTFIMNSAIVAGIGNIYANESLFAASIHPGQPASSLSLKQWQTLIRKIREILLWAIDCGGSTINDFINASGEQGYFQANFKVYGRKDAPCPSCSSPLQKSVISGRASYFCLCCQKDSV